MITNNSLFSLNRNNQLVYETIVQLLVKRAKLIYEISNSESEVSRINRSMLVQKLDQMMSSESQDFIY